MCLLDAVVRYSCLPSNALFEFIATACRAVNIQRFCPHSWKVLRSSPDTDSIKVALGVENWQVGIGDLGLRNNVTICLSFRQTIASQCPKLLNQLYTGNIYTKCMQLYHGTPPRKHPVFKSTSFWARVANNSHSLVIVGLN